MVRQQQGDSHESPCIFVLRLCYSLLSFVALKVCQQELPYLIYSVIEYFYFMIIPDCKLRYKEM